MKASDFEYHLPPALIAQEPLTDRSASRLLVLHSATGAVEHRRFTDIVDLIAPADVLVLNVSRVIPARLRGLRSGGGAAELLLVRAEPDGTWLAMGHPGRKLKPGRTVVLGPDSAAEIVEVLENGLRRIRFIGALDAQATFAKYGDVPLPPYIRRPTTAADRARYQTVYAAHDGSVAAPTAGLHFTSQLLDRVRARGSAVAALDLHVGPGTFKPVDVENLATHVMHTEAYGVSEETAALINARRAAGGRVWAVGTTVVRTLETVADAGGRVHAGTGLTDIFIYPPYRARAVDRLVTNFHLPRSTLLMLVAALGGHDAVLAAYREAVREAYRFYSYGDAMAVL